MKKPKITTVEKELDALFNRYMVTQSDALSQAISEAFGLGAKYEAARQKQSKRSKRK